MRYLVVGVGLLVLAVGIITAIRPLVDRLTPKQLAATNSTISVVDDLGSPLRNRLVVVFVSGTEAGRTDATGQLHGQLPASIRSIGTTFSIREGEARVLTFPPEEQVIAYAFPGDSARLPFEVISCRLTVTKTGIIRCPEIREEVPGLGNWLMSGILMMLLFPLATASVQYVAPWPTEFGAAAKRTAGYVTGALLAGLVVLMFGVTGVIERWIFALTDIFAGAVDVMLGAIAVVVGIAVFWTRIRAYFFRPK